MIPQFLECVPPTTTISGEESSSGIDPTIIQSFHTRLKSKSRQSQKPFLNDPEDQWLHTDDLSFKIM